MLESFPFAILIGTFLGFLAGLGTGGGSLLILWLTLVLDMPAETAKGINLMFFIPSALIACIFRWKQGAFSLKKGMPATLAGCIAAGVFSWVGNQLDVILLKKLFGGLLIFIGIKELFYRTRKDK